MRIRRFAGPPRAWIGLDHRVPTGAPAFVIGWLAGVYVLVRLTGGTPNPLVHLAYLGIAVAGVTGGWRFGMLVGVAAGLLLGPLMPDSSVANGEALGQWGWLIRSLAYVSAGLSTGVLWQRSARLIGALQDADRRHRADESIKASERRFQQLVATSRLGIVLFDGDGQITVVNPAAAVLLGAPEARLIETGGALPRPLTMPHGESIDRLSDLARLIMRAQLDPPRLDLVVERPNGSTALVAIVAGPILVGDGVTVGASLTLHDVTDDRARERARAGRIEEVHRVAALASAEPTAVAAGERLLAELASITPAVSSVMYVFDGDGANLLAGWKEPGLQVSYPARVTGAQADRLRELGSSGRPVRLQVEQVLADPAALTQIQRVGGRSKVVIPLRDDRDRGPACAARREDRDRADPAAGGRCPRATVIAGSAVPADHLAGRRSHPGV